VQWYYRGELSVVTGVKPMTRTVPLKLDTTTPILVINLGEYPLHQGSLGIIRSLGQLGAPTYIVQRRRFMPAGASRYLAGRFIWDMAGDDIEGFLEGMAVIEKTIGRPMVLIPTDDLTAILVAEHAEVMPASFMFARPPASVARTLANKLTLYHLCRNLGVACAETTAPGSPEEFRAIAERASFPVIVKADAPWMLPSGIKSTTIAWRRSELLSLYEKFSHVATSARILIQEMIPIGKGEDWFVHAYCDVGFNVARAFTGVKLRSFPPHAGPTTFGKSVRNEVLQQEAIGFLKAVGYRGIVDMDYRLDQRDGRYKLLDCNPRIGAQFRLFEDDAGIDVARALYLDITGQSIPDGRQIDERTFVVDFKDVLARCSYFGQGRLRTRGRRGSFQRAVQRAWFASDDLRPFLLMCLWILRSALSRLFSIRNAQVCGGASPRFRSRPPRRQVWRHVRSTKS
jgi:D-aspartate ligase